MRIASRLFASLALVLSLPSTQAAAQQPNNKPPTCDGKYNIVRVSEIKPGMMDKFFEAVSAQQAWYKKVGTSDQIAVTRVIDMKAGFYSTTEALTFHISTPSSAPRPPQATTPSSPCFVRAPPSSPSTSPAWQSRPPKQACSRRPRRPPGLAPRPSPPTPIATKLQAAPRPDTSPGVAQPPLIAPSQ